MHVLFYRNSAIPSTIDSSRTTDLFGLTMSLKLNPSSGSFQPITTATDVDIGDDISLIFQMFDGKLILNSTI